MNDVEAMELSTVNDISKATVYLKDLGPDVVFVTLGKKESWLLIMKSATK
ncbi:hypothetical protein GTO27_05185 [Candidatus Bathyarchaeota archaeon]|nr:hypothetical protein [Candidatus Bathyarchaeota archaeon]